MPIKIPRYESQVNPLTQSPNVVVKKPEFLTAGMKGYGEEVQKAGLTGLKIIREYEEEKQRTQDYIEKNRVLAEMNKDHYETEQMFTDDPNYETFTDKMKERQTQLQEKYKGMIKNPKNWEGLQPTIQSHFGVENVYVDKIRRQKEIIEMKSNLTDIGKIYTDVLAIEDNPDTKQEYLNAIEEMAKDNLTNNVFTAQEAETWKKNILTHADLKRVENDAIKDPMGTLERLRTDPFSFYPNLEQGHLDTARAYVGAMVQDKKDKMQEAYQRNKNTATLIATGDTYTTPEGNSIPLTPELKDAMLRQMLKDGTIHGQDYTALRSFIFPSGGKPKTEGKPNWIYMYKTDDKGKLTDKVIANGKDPDTVLELMEKGYSKSKPTKVKRDIGGLLKDVQIGGQPTGNKQTLDPIGLRTK